MHYNNLGCIHFHLRRHNLGVFYFRKALQENENVVREMRRSSDQQGRQHGGDNGMGCNKPCILLTSLTVKISYLLAYVALMEKTV